MKIILRLLGLSSLMFITWILGMEVANSLLGIEMPTVEVDPGKALGLMFLVCLINSALLLVLIYYARLNGTNLVLLVFATLWGIQFFMSQIETLWFNEGVQMSKKTILSVCLGGMLMAMAVAFLGVRLMRNIRHIGLSNYFFKLKKIDNKALFKVGIFCLLIYPLLYFFSGYFIAWQSEAVRLFYTGSTEKASFIEQTLGGISDGLYLFQIIRAILWIAFAYLILYFLQFGQRRNAILVGLSFAFFLCSQLIIPNPFMPVKVAMMHFLETTTSTFLWGWLIVTYLSPDFIEYTEANL